MAYFGLELETWIAIGALIATGLGALKAYLRLEAKVNQLRRDIDNHPLLSGFNEYLKHQGIIDFFSNQLANSKVEKDKVGEK